MQPPETQPFPSSPSPRRRKGPWSQAEIEKLKRKFGRMPDGALARHLNRSVDSLRRMASKCFGGPKRQGPWTTKEIENLKDYWGGANIDTLEMILGRTKVDIQHKVQELLGHLVSRPWTKADDDALKRHYGTRTSADLQVILGRPIEDIEKRALHFRLAKDKSFQCRNGSGKPVRMPRWTAEDVAKLKEVYAETPNLEIANLLERSVKSVVSKAHDLGLKKSPKRLADMGRENVKIRYQQKDEDDAPQAESAADRGRFAP